MNYLVLAEVISGSGLLSVFVQVMVVAIICWLLWWLVGFISPPQPFLKVLQVLIAVAAVIFLINALLSLGGHGFIRW